MTKNAYSYIKQAIRNNLKQKLITWRKEKVVEKLDKPTDIGRARNLGYKDRKGFVIARVRVKRGGHKKPRPRKGRRSKRMTIRKSLKMNYQWICEQRAQRKFKNLEVLNSYQIAKDGQHYFYEVILVDPNRPEIKKSKELKWIANKKNKKRVLRGLTRAGKKARGIGTKKNPKPRKKKHKKIKKKA